MQNWTADRSVPDDYTGKECGPVSPGAELSPKWDPHLQDDENRLSIPMDLFHRRLVDSAERRLTSSFLLTRLVTELASGQVSQLKYNRMTSIASSLLMSPSK